MAAPEAVQTRALVLPPPANLRDASAMEQLAGTLSSLRRAVALEILGLSAQRMLTVAGEAPDVRGIEAHLYSVYRQIETMPFAAPNTPASSLAERCWHGASLVTVEPGYLPLKTWMEFELQDPLDGLLGAFDGLRPDEVALSQLILGGPAPANWANPHLRQLVALKRRGYGADAPAPTANIAAAVGGGLASLVAGALVLWAMTGDWTRWIGALPLGVALVGLAGWLFSRSDNRWGRVLEEEAASKLRDRAYQVELRLFASAASEMRAREILDRLAGAYQLYSTTSGNRFEAQPLPSGIGPEDISLPAGRPMLLSAREIAGLWHIPVGESLERVQRQTYERLLPLPGDVSHPDGATIGVSRKGQHALPVSLSLDALRRNIFIIGKTQHGKSTLMEHIAAGWMRDRARSVLVVDPHGDLARRVIGLVPRERIGDVIYIDLSDESRAVGLNLIDVSDGSDPDILAETFVDVGRALWQKYWGPRMLIPLSFGLRALAQANLRRPPDRQYTLLSLAPFLTCRPNVRSRLLEDEVPLDERPDVALYFQGEYASLSPGQREQVISPVLSKCHAFERSAAIRRLVGQPRSTLRLFDAIRNRRIIVLNTNTAELGEDLAGFMGSLFLNVMRSVITRQNALPREQRVQVSVVADEFQTMPGTDFGALLGELQKNGGNFVLGTQALDNLRRGDDANSLAGSILAGVATKVVFQVNGDDARYLVERELDVGRLRAESLVNLPPYTAYVKTIAEGGRPVPVYSMEISPPLTPDQQVIAGVLQRCHAYSTPATEAESLARRSLTVIKDEYQRAQEQAETAKQVQARAAVVDAGAPPDSPSFVVQSGSLTAATQPVSETHRDLQAALARLNRPKAQPPGWTMQQRANLTPNQLLGNVADELLTKNEAPHDPPEVA